MSEQVAGSLDLYLRSVTLMFLYLRDEDQSQLLKFLAECDKAE